METIMRWQVFGASVLAAFVLGGCQEAAKPVAPAPARPLIIASFFTLADFARQIAGDRAEVVSLVPAGVESHDWEPSPRDVTRVEKATVFIYNGSGFDPGAERLAKTSVPASTVVVEATAGLPLVRADLPGHDKAHDKEAHGDKHADKKHGHDKKHDDDKKHGEKTGGGTANTAKAESEQDPHVWLDPTLAVAQVEAIRAGLAKANPANADHYASNAKSYAARLTALHEAFTTGLAQCKRREIVVSHAAFTYLADRYKLLQIPVMGLAPQAEPSPAELARVVRLVRRLKANVIFFETLVSPRLAETLAAEVGAKTLVLNPVEGLTAEEEKAGKDYVALMQDNLANLRAALDCR
jgi:zinc transport system substrate-binding protein